MAPRKATGRAAPRAGPGKSTGVKKVPTAKAVKASNKSVSNKKAQLLVKSATKKLAKPVAKPVVKTDVKVTKAATPGISPSKTAKTAAKGKSRPAKATTRKASKKLLVKLPAATKGKLAARSPVKSGRKSPAKPVGKSPAKSPTKTIVKSTFTGKATNRSTTKARNRQGITSPKSPRKSAVGTPASSFAPSKSPMTKREASLKRWGLLNTQCGQPLTSPGKVQASTPKGPRKNTAAAKVQGKQPTTTGSPEKSIPSRYKIIIQKNVVPDQKKGDVIVKTPYKAGESRQPPTATPKTRKNTSNTPLVSHVKGKTESAIKVSKSVASQSKDSLSYPPRPTRVICLPARLRDAALERQSRSAQKKPSSKVSPVSLKSPPKPTRLLPKADTRPSRSDMISRKDLVLKSKQSGTPSRKLRTTQEDKIKRCSILKSAEKPILKKETGKGKANEKSMKKGETAKPTPKKVTIVEPPKEMKKQVEASSSPGAVSHPCRHCRLVFRSRSDAELHEHRCDKNLEKSDKRYSCNKCSGMFTMSDLILHKKQAHPQRVETKDSTVGEEDSEKPAVPSTGIVVKVPKGGNLSDVIRQAVQAAANAGLVPANKKVVVSGPNIKSNITAHTKEKTQANVSNTKQSVTAEKQKTPNVNSAPSFDGNRKRKSQEPQTKSVMEAKKKKVNTPETRVAVVSPAVKTSLKSLSAKVVASLPAAGQKSPQPQFFTCLDCGNRFPSRKEVASHKAECPGVGKSSVHACMDCSMTYLTRAELNAHKREKHVATKSTASKTPAVTVRSYKCSECELFFPIESEAKKHIEEIHGGAGESAMCNVIATPEDLRSGAWNRRISDEMVEEVITNLVNGATKGKESAAEEGAEEPDDLTSPSEAAPLVQPPDHVAAPSSISIPTSSPGPSSPVIEMASSRQPGQCLDCFMKVNSRLELARHKRQCEKAIQNRQLFCFDCSSSFKSYLMLSRHKQEMHYKNQEYNKPFEKSTPKKTVDAETTSSSNASMERQNDESRKSRDSQKEEQQASTKKTKVGKTVNETKKSEGQYQRVQEVSPRTRSGRVVQKKKDDDDVIVEKVVQGRKSREKRTHSVETPQAIGTIEIIPEGTGDYKAESSIEREEVTPAITRRQTVPSTNVKEKGVMRSPQKQSFHKQDAEAAKKQEMRSPKKQSLERSLSPVNITPSLEPVRRDSNQDDRTSISLANGLVTISADKANDYQIFVDAKKDGSSIQVKLIRNEESTKTGKEEDRLKSTATPSSDGSGAEKAKSITIEEEEEIVTEERTQKRNVEQFVERLELRSKSPNFPKRKPIEPIEIQPIISGTSELPDNPVEADVIDLGNKTAKSQKKKKETTHQARGEPAQSVKPVSEKVASDLGKVVQKGKPFVMGGQTLVPIQFPPGFELPGGETGGQKVFAIPSTNLPPGLIQLLAKQNKATSAPQQPAKQKAPTKQTAADEPKETPTKITAPGAKTKHPLEVVPTKASADAQAQDPPASLKGMTGSQLMARAQARILGRPLPPLKPEDIPVFMRSTKKPPLKKGTPPKKPFFMIKKVTPAKKEGSEKEGNTTKALPAKGPLQPENIVVPSDKPSSRTPYKDPLFVYQCTSCQKNFKSTGEVNKHMDSCPVEFPETSTKRRGQKRQKGTDVWHIKPVKSAKGDGQGKSSSGEGVEWFVASKTT